jgi:hypothetical protein
MKSHGAGTAVRTGIAGQTDGKHEQDESAKECERAEEVDGAFGDGHRSAAGGSGKAATQGNQGGPGDEQKDARDGVLRVHQQENARLSEWIRAVGR